jgi:glycosyltransferase involved in cell wall biosynthesis
MTIKGIRYTGPILDNSGYARACRGNILALHNAGIPITLNPISFEKLRPDLGRDGEIINSLINKHVNYNFNIIHSTPEFWEKYVDPNVTNVAYTIWETTKLHPDWPKYINKSVDKVLVGCEWNKGVFKDSGVTIPIGVVPHGISKQEYDGVNKFNIAGVTDDDFMFYSIFQWTERKHPLALIKAYYHAFSGVDDVVLVLKTYRSDYSDNEKKAIRTTLQRLKAVMPMDHYPKVVLIPDILTEDEIAAVHQRGDCYASLDRGEGFGLSPFQAGAAGNPIIVTGFGGSTEYAKEDNSYLVDYQPTPVYGMPWSPWYRGDQCWAEPNIVHGAELMKQVYNNREEAKTKGKKLQNYIYDNFSWECIAEKIITELENI